MATASVISSSAWYRVEVAIRPNRSSLPPPPGVQPPAGQAPTAQTPQSQPPQGQASQGQGQGPAGQAPAAQSQPAVRRTDPSLTDRVGDFFKGLVPGGGRDQAQPQQTARSPAGTGRTSRPTPARTSTTGPGATGAGPRGPGSAGPSAGGPVAAATSGAPGRPLTHRPGRRFLQTPDAWQRVGGTGSRTTRRPDHRRRKPTGRRVRLSGRRHPRGRFHPDGARAGRIDRRFRCAIKPRSFARRANVSSKART